MKALRLALLVVAAPAFAGIDFDTWLSLGGGVIRGSRYDVIVADVVSLEAGPFTNDAPPRGTIEVVEVLRGNVPLGKQRALWRPAWHGVDWGDVNSNPAVIEWKKRAFPAPPLGKGQVLVGSLDGTTFLIAPAGALGADKRAYAIAEINAGAREMKAAEQERAAQAKREADANAKKQKAYDAWCKTLPAKVSAAFKTSPEVVTAQVRGTWSREGRNAPGKTGWSITTPRSLKGTQALPADVDVYFQPNFPAEYAKEVVAFGKLLPAGGPDNFYARLEPVDASFYVVPATPEVMKEVEKAAAKLRPPTR